MTRLLEEARGSFNTARLMMETRRGHARAYSEYLTAYQLVVDCIPRNPEFLDRIQTSRGGLHRQYKELMRVRLVVDVGCNVLIRETGDSNI